MKETATKYKSKYGKIPTLFIDGADVLAKYQEDLFKHVIHHAKVFANVEFLTIVFVSSKGSILPVVQNLLEISRSTKLFELTNIQDDEAVNYLVNQGLSKQLSKEIGERVKNSAISMY